MAEFDLRLRSGVFFWCALPQHAQLSDFHLRLRSGTLVFDIGCLL
ncbi:unnamed protein product [Ectocarpus sp. CCAP 1310/34]|nr:unnamed protein product [Ectocarpus sp. CCAP 1310/34]